MPAVSLDRGSANPKPDPKHCESKARSKAFSSENTAAAAAREGLSCILAWRHTRANAEASTPHSVGHAQDASSYRNWQRGQRSMMGAARFGRHGGDTAAPRSITAASSMGKSKPSSLIGRPGQIPHLGRAVGKRNTVDGLAISSRRP